MIRKHLVGIVLATMAATAMAQDAAPYTVAEGNKVDAKTMTGWRTWRAAACERCHGANQEGLRVVVRDPRLTVSPNPRA